jgi:mannose-6-phosphate isomerase-like protein (cupin superfamily)
MSTPEPKGWRCITIGELPRLPRSEGATWRPIRRALGLTGIAANAYTADKAGDEVIEPHDERSPNAGGHEELYLVASGVARFAIGDQQVDAPAGALIAIDVGVERQATALEAGTTVLVVGGKPGAAYPPAPFEYWYAAEPHYLAGDYERGLAVLREGLEHHPFSPGLNYQLACYSALAGQSDEAIHHLRIALDGGDARIAGWAREDTDLASLRARPDWPLAR